MRTSRESRDGWIGEKLNEAEHIAWNACEIITRFARKVNLRRHKLNFSEGYTTLFEKQREFVPHGPWQK
jgi:hypothetical protein